MLDDVIGSLEGEEALGARLVREALQAPLSLISENAGYEAPVVVESVRSGEGDWGFNAELGEYTHLIQAGIIDPVKVTPVGAGERGQHRGYDADHGRPSSPRSRRRSPCPPTCRTSCTTRHQPYWKETKGRAAVRPFAFDDAGKPVEP